MNVTSAFLFFTRWTHFKRIHWTENAQCHFYNTFIIYSLTSSLNISYCLFSLSRSIWESGGMEDGLKKSQRHTQTNKTNEQLKCERGVEKRKCVGPPSIWPLSILFFWGAYARVFPTHTFTHENFLFQYVQRATFWRYLCRLCLAVVILNAGKINMYGCMWVCVWFFCFVCNIKSINGNNFFSRNHRCTIANTTYHPIDIFSTFSFLLFHFWME